MPLVVDAGDGESVGGARAARQRRQGECRRQATRDGLQTMSLMVDVGSRELARRSGRGGEGGGKGGGERGVRWRSAGSGVRRGDAPPPGDERRAADDAARGPCTTTIGECTQLNCSRWCAS